MSSMLKDLLEDQVLMYDYLDINYEKINGYDFYKDIFPNNQNKGDYSKESKNDYIPNAIYLYKPEEDEKKNSKRTYNRRLMLNDTWEEDYINNVECNKTALCSGLAYLGKANKLNNSYKMNALIIDLDSVGYNELRTLFLRFGRGPEKLRSMPMPTYIVMSGTGLHIYYVLDEPIDLYPNIKLQLKSLKHDLTFRLWDYKSTTKLEEIQYQSINQNFRMVGSMNDKYNKEVVAFRIGEKVSLETLNSYVKEESRVDINKRYRPTEYTLSEAKEKFPEWYEKVIVNGDKTTKKWVVSKDVYNWWLRQIEKATGGHRYYYLMCLSIYAYKCDVSKEELEKDMWDVFDVLAEIAHTNPLKKEDVEAALEVYNMGYYNFTKDDISKLSAIPIKTNKRNGQSQAYHLEEARMLRDMRMKRQNKNWYDGGGRPKGSGTKESLVREYVKNNPIDNPTEISKGLGVSRTTVYKYLKVIKK